MAFGLGLGLMTTMMSFNVNSNLTQTEYGYVPSAPPGSRWVDLTGQIKDGEEVGEEVPTYGCNGDESICTAIFEDSLGDPNLLPNTEVPTDPFYTGPVSTDDGEFFTIP